MELFKISLLTMASIITLFIIIKLIGNREMSQMNMLDYINSITIGSIAAEFATDLENPLHSFLAMVIYGIVILICSILTSKSMKIRKFITGETMILFNEGKIYMDNLKKSKMDMNEFLMQCRVNGYFNIADIETALIETNGKISFLVKEEKKNIMLEDMNIVKEQEKLVTNIIMDGKIIKESLKKSNKEEKWLDKELKKQKIKIEDVALGTVDKDNNLSIYIKFKNK